MEKNYETKMMYRAFTGNGTVLFENKADAEAYETIMKDYGINVILNKWTWETKIEK